MPIGTGTLVNVLTVLIGGGLGLLLGERLPERVRTTVTGALGLITLVIAAQAIVALGDEALVRAVGESAPLLIVLGALLMGGIVGSLARLEDRLTGLGDVLRRWLSRGASEADAPARARFVDGFVVSSLVFCVGPLAILGSLQEGIGDGPDQLLLKATLDGFASVAFAASLGAGVLASAVSVGVIQGGLTLTGVLVGGLVPDAQIAAVTATGGVLLLGVALRLLDLGRLRVGDLLPALLVAPLLTSLISSLR